MVKKKLNKTPVTVTLEIPIIKKIGLISSRQDRSFSWVTNDYIRTNPKFLEDIKTYITKDELN